MNDPVAVILVVGLIDAIEMPDYGAGDMVADLPSSWRSGSSSG